MMNKCILCTFFKMIWDGLWNNVCPSIDKKKEEKKAPVFKIIIEGIFMSIFAVIFAVSITVLIIAIGYLILSFIAWIFRVTFDTVMIWFLFGILMPTGLIVLIKGAIEFTKIRIACIKAYWAKAKEECA